MDILIGAFKLLYWACVGVSMFLMGAITLLIGLFALIGRMSWLLLFEQPKDRSVSAGPQRTKFED